MRQSDRKRITNRIFFVKTDSFSLSKATTPLGAHPLPKDFGLDTTCPSIAYPSSAQSCQHQAGRPSSGDRLDPDDHQAGTGLAPIESPRHRPAPIGFWWLRHLRNDRIDALIRSDLVFRMFDSFSVVDLRLLVVTNRPILGRYFRRQDCGSTCASRHLAQRSRRPRLLWLRPSRVYQSTLQPDWH